MAKDVDVCPKCGSTNLERTTKNLYKVRQQSSNFVCLDCNYAGIFLKVDVDVLEEFRKELKNSKKK